MGFNFLYNEFITLTFTEIKYKILYRLDIFEKNIYLYNSLKLLCDRRRMYVLFLLRNSHAIVNHAIPAATHICTVSMDSIYFEYYPNE